MSFTTFRSIDITFAPPVRPPILMPGKTLEGNDDAPSEPGALPLLCCPCVCPPTPAKPCRFTTPWNHLPFDQPRTSTIVSVEKSAAVITSPSLT